MNMKIAFHFNAGHESLGSYYGYPIRKALLSAVLNSRTMDLDTKVFEGDLLLAMLTMDREMTETGESRQFNKDRLSSAIQTLLNPGSHVWMSFDMRIVDALLGAKVFVILLESISFRNAQDLDRSLRELPYYLGALQVDGACSMHWVAYSESLVAAYRIVGKALFSFWDGVSEDSKDERWIEEFRRLGFTRVEFEALNGKFTVFDKYDDFEQARRVAELGDALSDSLGFLADQVITRLSDTVPELGNKLWSAIQTYDRAEVVEDYAQVAISCRRLIKYMADQVFPPQDTPVGGRKVGPAEYRNRLLAYADNERASDTNIDLICVSTEMLSQQLEKLGKLAHKGVHADIYRHEARRCLLRTIMILDDILSLRERPLEIKPHLDLSPLLDA
jgi:hypothetical protein